ncbi:MAG TPA: hypothetical protein VKT28_10455 [Puia sp.]|nr:hypothetical protein [Puia sp.]
MKSLFAFVIIVLLANNSFAQFYYQDIIATQQANEKWKTYKDNKTKSVIISSFESNNLPTEGFECRQTVSKDYSQISTYTKTDFSREASLISFYTATGQLQKTIDTSKNYQSTTEYLYDAYGNISSIKNSSTETSGEIKNSEQHLWKYGSDGKPLSMLKIKNNTDTTFISFVKDEKGNIAEEHATRNRFNLPTIYYYYDDNKRLTDIVRYNEKAKRLLPDYVFTYTENNKLSSMLFVPEGSNNYQKWLYEYNEQGLRTKETCFNKQKEMLGKIEYQYSFNNF